MFTSSSLPQKRIYRITVSSFSFFLAGLCFSSWASRIPDIQLKLHLNNGALGAVLLGLPAGLLISLPIAGWMVAKFGSRSIAIGAAISYACLLPVLGFAQNTVQLVACLLFSEWPAICSILPWIPRQWVRKLYTDDPLWLPITAFGAWQAFQAPLSARCW